MLVASVAGQTPAPDSPLPDPQQLRQRAIANMRKSEKDLERYSCIVREEQDELDGNGKVKQHHSKEEEQFYVNGQEIQHTLSKDGKPLTGGDAKKEQERVDKEVKKYSDLKQVQKEQEQGEKQVDMFMRALRYTNGHREWRDGRSTVVYDLLGDPNFHPKKIEERFAQALTGRIWVDEESGAPVELRVQTDRDVKIGGGMLANVHKGFQLHLVQQRQPEGVWITKSVDGSGDLRAALFFHPRFRFKQGIDKCHLFSVETQTTTQNPTDGEAKKPQ
jgi:hypothetical protein